MQDFSMNYGSITTEIFQKKLGKILIPRKLHFNWQHSRGDLLKPWGELS